LDRFGSSGVIDTAGAKIDDFKVEYLPEFKAICKKAITLEPGPKWDCLMKKIRGRKSRDTDLSLISLQDKKHGDWEHRVLHNMYGLLYTMATHQGQLIRSDSALRPFVLTRSAFAGSQR
jgi:alpha-glucosidase (family GH31 glycosyl hydrolase)